MRLCQLKGPINTLAGAGRAGCVMRACQRHVNNALQWLTHRAGKPITTTDTPVNQADNVRYFANPGPDFEDRGTPNNPCAITRARAIAFYLPQFHAFAENDEWWGKGFTEWRNVARASPRFDGHYQPRIPRDLGHYDLGNKQVLNAQAELARAAGINGFCFYYYWFNGKRLMEKPLDLFLDSEVDQDFCIMWANENWTRRWDGREQDVMIAQQYRESDEKDFIEDTARYMKHARYITINDRPLFILYRANLVPDTVETIERWRRGWTNILGATPLVYMVQSYSDLDPTIFGCDGAIEFPPHKISRDLKRRNHEYTLFDPAFSGQIRAYKDVIDKSLSEAPPPYPLIKTVSPHWDNDARREGRGVCFQGSTPSLYSRWLNGVVEFAQANPVENESVVFINAWNEWAESAYLEPDVHYGHAYLNATYRTLKARRAKSNRLLLVGHDAHQNGAQMLLLELARLFKFRFGLDIQILLKSGGKLLDEYKAIAQTTVMPSNTATDWVAWFRQSGCRHAIFNTCVTGDMIADGQASGMRCMSMVHEMPALISEYGLQAHLHNIAEHAHHVVFASQQVMDGFRSFESRINGSVKIQPQGMYKKLNPASSAREHIRLKLGLKEGEKLVLNVGYADNRKGFDRFCLAAARHCMNTVNEDKGNLHFCWVGKRSKNMTRWLKQYIGKRLDGRLHLIDFTPNIADWYSSADCLFLSSREDPFPSVVLEAMSLGLPIVLIDGTTGLDDAVISLNYQAADTVNDTDIQLLNALQTDTDCKKEQRRAHVKQAYVFVDYGKELLQMLEPDWVDG